jgi:hypothetical protein
MRRARVVPPMTERVPDAYVILIIRRVDRYLSWSFSRESEFEESLKKRVQRMEMLTCTVPLRLSAVQFARTAAIGNVFGTYTTEE